MSISYAWAPITKSEEQDDGTIVVHGPAATSEIDRDRQRLDQGWLDEALPRWLAPASSSGTAGAGGAVREQHDPKRAVGVGIGLSKADDGRHYLTARIVDPVAVKKIKHGVLKGFSVGIKNPRVEMGKTDAPNGLVTGGDIIEVSVCDSPANGSCYFQMAKADAAGSLALIEDPHVIEKADSPDTFGLPAELYDRLAAPVKEALTRLADSGAAVSVDAIKADDATSGIASPSLVIRMQGAPVSEELLRGLINAELGKADLSAAGRKKAATSGAAMPDGSYPITTKADLRKAVKAVGRGGADHDKIRKHIVTRARALGLENLVPDNWNSDGSLKDASKADALDAAATAETVAKAEQILRDVRALAPSLTKADDGEQPPATGDDESMDIAGAEQAIACIAKLIIAEAESLALGNLNEAMDISLLLDAVRSLAWFKNREEQEQNGDSDADMGLADQPDTTKTDTPATPAVEPAPKTPDTPQVPDTLTKADVAELVKAAVAEASEAAKERETALAEELTKAQQAIEEFRTMPVPGGPALTRTADQQAQARNTDADRLRAEAKGLMAKADAAVDPVLRKGYSDRAAELLEKADA
jgi:hypothetical protein